MAGNSAFTNQGATFPSNPTVPNILSGFQKPNPLTSALQSASGNYTPPSGSRSVGAVGSTGGYDTAPNIPSAPTSGIKKQTVISPTGHQVTTEYHAPTAGILSTKDTPITGTATTPSGAQVDATSGGLISGPTSSSSDTTQNQAPTDTPATYPGLINNLNKIGTQGSDGYNKAVKALSDFNSNLAQKYGDMEGGAIPLEFVQGREQVLARQAAAQQASLQGAVTAQQTQQGQQINALGTAAGLVAPQLAGFNQQSFNPLTGQFGAGTGGSTALSQLPSQAQDAINSYAQQVQNGQMTRADAESRLSAYGVAGTNALNEALGSGFNTNASNASANTTQQGQQLQTAAHATTQALDSLQTLFSNLSKAQTGGIPATNSVANWIAGALGSSALTQYNQTLHDARAQLQGVLTASGGATPTGAEAMAVTYLPDNMTASQLSAAIANVKNLVQQKVSSFTQSGQQNNQNQNGTNNSSGSNIYSF